MFSYWRKSVIVSYSRNPSVAKTSKGKLLILSKCAVCYTKKLRYIKEREASGLLSSLGIKTCLLKIPLVGPP